MSFHFDKQSIHDAIDKNFDLDLESPDSALYKTFMLNIKPQLESCTNENELANAIYDSLLRVANLSVHLAAHNIMLTLENLKN